MSLSDTDSKDLWDEIHRRLGIEDAAAPGKITPLLTVVKPIRLVTLIKQDTVMIGQDTCPPGSVDMSSSPGASPTSTGLHAILDRRLAAYDRERETAERVRHQELLAAVDQRLNSTLRKAPDRRGSPSPPTLEDSRRPELEALVDRLEARLRDVSEDIKISQDRMQTAADLTPAAHREARTDRIPEEAIDSVRAELRAIHDLLTRPSGRLAKTESPPLPPSSAEPRPTKGDRPPSPRPSAPSSAHPRDPQSERSAVHLSGPAEVPSAGSARPWVTLFPWSALLLVTLAALFFTCGVVVHALLPGAPPIPTSEVTPPLDPTPAPTPAPTHAPTPVGPSPADPAAAVASPGPTDSAASRPFPDTATPDRSSLLDSDGDGLFDPGQRGLQAAAIDRCPNTPGPAEGQGCPTSIGEDAAPDPLRAIDGVIEGVHFDTDRATLRADSIEILDRALAVLRQHPATRIEISGHTDSAGGYQHNIELSKARAEAVRDYLVDGGLAADRLETAGYGPDRPIDDNRTRAGRLRNRRIEFKLLK